MAQGMGFPGEASAGGEEESPGRMSGEHREGVSSLLDEGRADGGHQEEDGAVTTGFIRERQEQCPPDDMPPTPSKEGQGVEVYERPEDSIGKQQEPRRQAEDEEVRRQQQTKRQQQEHARTTTVPASRKEDLISASLRRAGSGAEAASVDDCVAALRSLPGGDAELPQIADSVAEFHRSYVTVPGYHKHTSRKVSEWIRACKHALHRARLQAARGPSNAPFFSSASCSPHPSSSAAASSSSSSRQLRPLLRQQPGRLRSRPGGQGWPRSPASCPGSTTLCSGASQSGRGPGTPSSRP